MNTPTRIAAALIGAQVVMAASFGLAMPHAHADEEHSVVQVDPTGDAWVLMPVCEHEDGRTDGRVCLWVDRTTGDAYVVTSDNYRQENA